MSDTLLSTSLAPFVRDRPDALQTILRSVEDDLALYANASCVSFPAAAYCVSREKADGSSER